ncbi:MAG: VCBS repeat-containing protein [Verrucomicrobia bacterium]|nr:VCBS repeat-containing protein [Verrucomicrobiota bacterium]
MLAVVVEPESGPRELVWRSADGEVKRQTLNAAFKSNPSALVAHDVDQDGRLDFVVLVPYEKIKVLRQAENGAFEEQDVAPPGGSADQPWVSRADVDGDGRPELLMAQRNFPAGRGAQDRDAGAGRRRRGRRRGFRVKEQINGASTRSRIVGAAPLATEDGKVAGLFLLDAELKRLTFTQRDEAGGVAGGA